MLKFYYIDFFSDCKLVIFVLSYSIVFWNSYFKLLMCVLNTFYFSSTRDELFAMFCMI